MIHKSHISVCTQNYKFSIECMHDYLEEISNTESVLFLVLYKILFYTLILYSYYYIAATITFLVFNLLFSASCIGEELQVGTDCPLSDLRL